MYQKSSQKKNNTQPTELQDQFALDDNQDYSIGSYYQQQINPLQQHQVKLEPTLYDGTKFQFPMPQFTSYVGLPFPNNTHYLDTFDVHNCYQPAQKPISKRIKRTSKITVKQLNKTEQAYPIDELYDNKNDSWNFQEIEKTYTDEDRKQLFDKTLTGFNVPLSEGYIIEQVRANIGKLKRPDGTLYKGNLYKTVKGSLTSNGIFKKTVNRDQETQWISNKIAAAEFEKRTTARIAHLAEKRKITIQQPDFQRPIAKFGHIDVLGNKQAPDDTQPEQLMQELVIHKYNHVYRLLNGFLDSHQSQQLNQLLDQIHDMDIDKYKDVLGKYNIELVQQGAKDCIQFFKDIVKSRRNQEELQQLQD